MEELHPENCCLKAYMMLSNWGKTSIARNIMYR